MQFSSSRVEPLSSHREGKTCYTSRGTSTGYVARRPRGAPVGGGAQRKHAVGAYSWVWKGSSCWWSTTTLHSPIAVTRTPSRRRSRNMMFTLIKQTQITPMDRKKAQEVQYMMCNCSDITYLLLLKGIHLGEKLTCCWEKLLYALKRHSFTIGT